jgi:hypothetical protein
MDENGKVSIKLDIHGTPAENLQRLITDCGVSPHKVRPYQESADNRSKNWSRNSRRNISQTRLSIGSFLNSITFATQSMKGHLGLVSHLCRRWAGLMIAYEDLYQSPTIVPENVRSLPLVFIVLAMAVRLAPEEWAGDDQTRKLSSLRLYWSCKSKSVQC